MDPKSRVSIRYVAYPGQFGGGAIPKSDQVIRAQRMRLRVLQQTPGGLQPRQKLSSPKSCRKSVKRELFCDVSAFSTRWNPELLTSPGPQVPRSGHSRSELLIRPEFQLDFGGTILDCACRDHMHPVQSIRVLFAIVDNVTNPDLHDLF